MKLQINGKIGEAILKQYHLKIDDIYYSIQYFLCERTY